jgi:hypothetical protein
MFRAFSSSSLFLSSEEIEAELGRLFEAEFLRSYNEQIQNE